LLLPRDRLCFCFCPVSAWLLLPLLLMQVENTAARVAAHAMWISPFLGVLYLQVYDYKEKPKWLLAVFEHCE
jgi:hypothetical protein